MMKLNRVYRGMMVDMRPTNHKLRLRAERMVVKIAGCTPQGAGNALAEANGDIKAASLIAKGVDADAAVKLIVQNDGNLRAALAELARS